MNSSEGLELCNEGTSVRAGVGARYYLSNSKSRSFFLRRSRLRRVRTVKRMEVLQHLHTTAYRLGH